MDPARIRLLLPALPAAGRRRIGLEVDPRILSPGPRSAAGTDHPLHALEGARRVLPAFARSPQPGRSGPAQPPDAARPPPRPCLTCQASGSSLGGFALAGFDPTRQDLPRRS